MDCELGALLDLRVSAMIVVDIGCKTWRDEDSKKLLVDRFRPRSYYGFDPYPDVEEVDADEGGMRVVIRRKAAWTHGGGLFLALADSSSRVGGEGDICVECFDLAKFIKSLDKQPGEELVVKMDCELAEWTLIPHLRKTGADELISLLLVEFHTRVPLEVWASPWQPV
jgi:hypothetical protein